MYVTTTGILELSEVEEQVKKETRQQSGLIGIYKNKRRDYEGRLELVSDQKEFVDVVRTS